MPAAGLELTRETPPATARGVVMHAAMEAYLAVRGETGPEAGVRSAVKKAGGYKNLILTAATAVTCGERPRVRLGGRLGPIDRWVAQGQAQWRSALRGWVNLAETRLDLTRLSALAAGSPVEGVGVWAEPELNAELKLDALNVRLGGKIDLLSVSDDGRAKVVDLKTGSADGVNAQLRLYAWLVLATRPDVTSVTREVWDYDGIVTAFEPCERAEMDALEAGLRAWLVTWAAAVGDATAKPARTPEACGFCPRWGDCEAADGEPTLWTQKGALTPSPGTEGSEATTGIGRDDLGPGWCVEAEIERVLGEFMVVRARRLVCVRDVGAEVLAAVNRVLHPSAPAWVVERGPTSGPAILGLASGDVVRILGTRFFLNDTGATLRLGHNSEIVLLNTATAGEVVG
nr:PD-(D/E)XK nuclease family protein [Plesiocystis pacifica]